MADEFLAKQCKEPFCCQMALKVKIMGSDQAYNRSASLICVDLINLLVQKLDLPSQRAPVPHTYRYWILAGHQVKRSMKDIIRGVYWTHMPSYVYKSRNGFPDCE